MQIISPIMGPGVYWVKKTTMQTPIDAHPGARPTDIRSSTSVDFSNVTPMQLQVYINDMIRSGRMTSKEGSALSSSIPHQWYTMRPDVAVDFTANMKGKLDAAHAEGSRPLAAFYSALMGRMKMMEAQGLPISVVA